MINNIYNIGVDIGSTTIKCVVTDSDGEVIYKSYKRHNAQLTLAVSTFLEDLISAKGNLNVYIAFTGSGAVGLTQRTKLTFVQEVVAASECVRNLYPDARTLLDIGGEDAKLVLFEKDKSPDIRMNGSCAGGTGAFIDQMATLMNISIGEMNEMAIRSTSIYPIASRCAVFAKTDVQNLLSRKVPAEDIAASLFYAVGVQVVNSLARGSMIRPQIIFCGGPLKYISCLRNTFVNILKLKESDVIFPEDAELFTAKGASLIARAKSGVMSLSDIQNHIKSYLNRDSSSSSLLKPLFFEDQIDLDSYLINKIIKTETAVVKNNEACYLGIDSGSTTTKIVIINQEGQFLYRFYGGNNGNPLDSVIHGLSIFEEQLKNEAKTVRFVQSAVTGYGEDLIRSALGIDHGIVETMAHYVAAKKIEPKVSFILDIGGQDIKAIFIENNSIQNIEINEACSSGCGSFIEGFAHSLNINVKEFAQMACASEKPYDLGSRCTVFMNSKVKQALKDGASRADISAGLAYSVINNCLYKVLKISNIEKIGEYVVVQGGTFKNPAVLKALEVVSGKTVVVSDKPELMGAYGAALYAIEKNDPEKPGTFSLSSIYNSKNYTTKYNHCKGCTNQCQITVFKFPNGNTCFSGNKCEKTVSNNLKSLTKGANFFEFKKDLLFNRPSVKDQNPIARIGIPRILNIYENFPFWNALFIESGFEVVLSDESTNALYRKGHGSIMSDSICYPAKIAHGHVINLVEKKVDRIFYPMVVFEQNDFAKADNSFNCPIVSSYAEVLKSSIDTEDRYNIPFDSPAINLADTDLMRKASYKYLSSLGVSRSRINKAFDTAVDVQKNYKKLLIEKNKSIYEEACRNNSSVMLLATHSYHSDQLIHQKISHILSDMGVSVISEEIAVTDQLTGFDQFSTISQWASINKVLQAAYWVSQQKENVEFIHLNSFGCGPDTLIMDEINNLLKRNNKTYTLIRIDEISSPGSIRLRLRSLVESIKIRNQNKVNNKEVIEKTPATKYLEEDRQKTILIPWFAEFYSPFIPALAKLAGYNVVNLPPSDQQSIEYGIKYANNEVCYPALLIVGDIVKALKSGNYDNKNIAVAMAQTGGQCRFTNYLSLIKMALKSSGFSDVPVISIASASDTYNEQPGFKINWKNLIVTTFNTLLYAEAISRLYYGTVSREIEKGSSDRLKEKYTDAAMNFIVGRRINELPVLLSKAVKEFNAIPVRDDNIPVVGIVGEIYIKLNAFGQYNITNWLISQNVEVVVAPLSTFFLQSLINSRENQKEFITPKGIMSHLSFFTEVLEYYYINKFEKVLKDFRFYRPQSDIKEEALLASKIVSLVNQYGEGWLIPGEVASFANMGINNVLCLQPFGCLANQIIGKGVENRIKKLHPDMNLLFLDFDQGTSELNIINRLYFLIKNASLQVAGE